MTKRNNYMVRNGDHNSIECFLTCLTVSVAVFVALGLYLYHNGTKTA